MNIFDLFADRVSRAMQTLYPDVEGLEDLVAKATMEPPRDAGHGDLSSNIAMVCAKELKASPRDIAGKLAELLAGDPEIESVEVAGPGFLNFRLTGEVWHKVLQDVLNQPEGYGKPDMGQGEKVNVEYVSANPTGPMHVGHTRGAVFGDALASLLEHCGYAVTREYYINDAGAQVDTLARSALLRYREALGEDVGPIPAGLYPGDYLVPVGEMLQARFGSQLREMSEAEAVHKIKAIVLEEMMDLIRSDLKKLGVEHETFFSEKQLHGENGKIAETLAWLRQEGLVYQGKLEPPKGKAPEDWEDREQTLFRATQFGDDTDRPLVKSDGTYAYFAADIAYHRDKYLRGFNDQIIVLGADHAGYVKRLQAAVKAISHGEAQIDVKICQLVRLMRDGQPVKMSKRSGELVTLADVVDEVGRDATRFLLLMRRNDAAMDFDFARVVEQTRDNPVFYVQYAHARACSVMRNAAKDLPSLDFSDQALKAADLTVLTAPEDLELIKAVAHWPRQVVLAARAHEPHRIANYLHDLSGVFHAFWTKGNQDAQLRFVNHGDNKLTLARVAMAAALRTVLGSGLGLLGVSAPENLT
ncbi:MAG: arginine--tRNA ligase [Hyphomicrobiaceae bacterium]|nr:arginine--tRNA ligase [Hyphomicrobiaceae bacterium]